VARKPKDKPKKPKVFGPDQMVIVEPGRLCEMCRHPLDSTTVERMTTKTKKAIICHECAGAS
jgi:hypothetical protein